jgi:hypothetical protein
VDPRAISGACRCGDNCLVGGRPLSSTHTLSLPADLFPAAPPPATRPASQEISPGGPPATHPAPCAARRGLLLWGHGCGSPGSWSRGGGRGGGQQLSLQQQPPSADAKTLFVGGVSNCKDRDFHTVFSGITSVKQPPGKNFAFVEFESHAAAQAVMTAATLPMGVSVRGRPVSVGWAAGRQGQGQQPGHSSCVALQSAPLNETCRSLFVAGLPPYVEEGGGGEAEGGLQQHLLSLFAGAVQVHRLAGKSFAFVDFDSHAAAAAAMSAYASDPEGHRAGRGEGAGMLSVGWSKSGGDNKSPGGDGNSSCWFCLASPTCKVSIAPVDKFLLLYYCYYCYYCCCYYYYYFNSRSIIFHNNTLLHFSCCSCTWW